MVDIPRLELDLEEAYNDLEIIDMELLTAQGEDRKSKLRLKRAILENIRKIDEKIWATRNKRRYVDEDYWDW